jgi:hypothetical protein
MNKELAKQAVACKRWRWMAGMKAVERRSAPTAWFRVEENVTSLLGEWKYPLPDIDDPATLGCLLALVREAYGFRLWLASSRDGDMWYVDAASGALAHGKTEAEALVAALEAAP